MRSLAIALLVGVLAMGPTAQAGGVSEAEFHDTTSRLSWDREEALVRGPMALVRAGRLADGQAAFERLLARRMAQNPNGVIVADTLMSFGVLLHAEGYEHEALDYVRRSVAAYRRAFGPDHPEVAAALHSVADVLERFAPDDPDPEADAALEEAYRIRLKALGPHNAETAITLARLGRIKGRPARTRGEAARIEASADLFRRSLAMFAVTPLKRDTDPPAVFRDFLKMYVDNGRIGEANALFTAEFDRLGRESADPEVDQSILVDDYVEMLEAVGRPADAARVRTLDPLKADVDERDAASR